MSRRERGEEVCCKQETEKEEREKKKDEEGEKEKCVGWCVYSCMSIFSKGCMKGKEEGDIYVYVCVCGHVSLCCLSAVSQSVSQFGWFPIVSRRRAYAN